MTIECNQINWLVRYNFVEEFLVGQSGRTKGWIRPAHAGNPGFVWMCCRVLLHPVLNLCHSRSAIQNHLRQSQRTVHEVNMAIGEAGQHQSSAEIDDLGGRVAIRTDVLHTANCENLLSSNGHR